MNSAKKITTGLMFKAFPPCNLSVIRLSWICLQKIETTTNRNVPVHGPG